MLTFAMAHPIITFLLACTAVNAVVIVLRGQPNRA